MPRKKRNRKLLAYSIQIHEDLKEMVSIVATEADKKIYEVINEIIKNGIIKYAQDNDFEPYVINRIEKTLSKIEL